jgi:hypothetical protein
VAAWLALAAPVVGGDVPAPAAADEAPAGETSPAPPEAAPLTESAAQESAPGDTLAEALAQELRRTLAFRQQLERLDAERTAAAARDRDTASAALERSAALAAEARVVPDASAGADRLYAAIVGELREARPRLRQALDVLRHPSPVPEFEPGLDAAQLDVPSIADEVARLRQDQAEIERTVERSRGLGAEQRWAAVERWGLVVERLDAARLEALAKLTDATRGEVLGIGREGIAQLGREALQLVLSARLYAARRLHDLDRVPAFLRDVFAVGGATYVLLRVAGVLFAGWMLARRGRRLREVTRRFLFGLARSARGRRRAEALGAALGVVAPWSLFLAVLWALGWALGPAAAGPELRVLLRIALLYGVYRLSIDVGFEIIVRLARRYRLQLDPERTRKLLRSVRTMMRVFIGIAVLLVLSAQFLGRGYLYHLVVRLAWVVVLVAAVRVLASWRSVIADAYLEVGPTGRLAELVRRTRDHWYGVFVAATSFGWLAGRAAIVLGRDFAMGFDQTRRALAFLFRRRIERQAERLGYAEVDVESLPGHVRDAFTEDPVSDGPRVTDRFPGLDRLTRAIEAWRGGSTGGSFLLTGERGTGKTSWLARARAGTDSLPVSDVVLRDRAHGEAELARALSPGGSSADGLDALRERLLAEPPRVIVVDLGQNLFLGTVGGYQAFESFASLVEATSRNVFWLCSISAFAWEHVAAVRPDLTVFRHHQELQPWSEEEIRELIRTRTAASGLRLTYDDLFLDRMEGVSAGERVLQTEEGYTRLLWDYSDGNPRVALHYWLRSLVLESPSQARVRLFRAPPIEELARVGEMGLFLLAAIVVHENLTLDEAVAVTRYPEGPSRIHLERLVELGALRLHATRYRVTTHWHRAVVRLLRRGNLLSD